MSAAGGPPGGLVAPLVPAGATTAPSAPPAPAAPGEPSGGGPPPPTRRKPSLGQTFESFRIRDFRYLTAGTLAAGFAQWAKQLALFALVYEMTGSAVQLGTVAAFRGGVGTIIAPYGGYLSDRFSRRHVVVLSTLLDAILAGMLAVLVLADQHEIWHVYVIAFGGGLAQSINQPARQAFVYDVTTDETLPNAIAVNSMVQNLARVTGPAGFGVMMAAWGIPSTLIALVVLQLLAILATLKVSRVTRQARVVAGTRAVTMMREGLAYCWKDRRVLGLIVIGAIPSLLVYPYMPFLKVVSEEVLGRGNSGYGMLSSMMGWGSLVGLLALATLGNARGQGRIMIGGYLGYAVLLCVFAWSSNYYLSLTILATAGIFHSLGTTLNNTLLLQMGPPEMRGRIMSVNQMAHGLQPIGSLPMAFAVAALGVQTGMGSFFVTALLAFALFGLVWASVRRL